MRLLASDLKRVDIAQLDPEALGNIKQLSVSLTLFSTPGLPPVVLLVSSTRANALYLRPSFPPGILTVVLLTWQQFCP